MLYLEGNDAIVGDKLDAAWIYHYPEFGKRGHRLLPRVTRALKGWHRHCPAQGRTPVPWIGIAMIVTEMMKIKEPARAYWVKASDRAQQLCSQESILKRGRWKQLKAAMR